MFFMLITLPQFTTLIQEKKETTSHVYFSVGWIISAHVFKVNIKLRLLKSTLNSLLQ